jgi:hypothetical protein
MSPVVKVFGHGTMFPLESVMRFKADFGESDMAAYSRE